MKTLMSVWIIFIMLALPGFCQIPLPGDIDADRKITLADAILGIQISSGSVSTEADLSGDINEDEKIGIPEAVYILQILSGIREARFTGFGTDSTFEILTWNLQDFPKTERTVNYVAEMVEILDADVIAFQEIESGSDFNALAEKDGWNGYRAESAYMDINLAYLCKENIIVRNVYEIYEEDWEAFPRSPYVIEITFNESPIVIINNHLKAYGDAESQERRRDASLKLKKYIDDVFPEANLILVGDLNDEINEPDALNVFQNFIADPEHYRFADMEIAEGPDTEWSYPSWPSHIDHILITDELFDEFDAPDAEVRTIIPEDYSADIDWYQEVSDHRPVGLRLMF